ncbi:MAG: FYDLN acid domain-containing protein [Paracoccus sp. (in: a-proteobacteria)]|nr:FYDLN acid domain-containing protein [Paracoccus sp. (in: a-proteobacteria)]
MPKEEWGTKRLCPHCATRFYDLQTDPMTCPACGAQFTVESLIQGRGKAIAAERSSARDSDQVDVLEDDADLDDDGGDLDDDLLEEDDDEGDVSLDDIADVGSDDED